MTRRIVFNDLALVGWVRAQQRIAFDYNMDVAIGTVDENGAPLGACIIRDYTGASSMLHMAARKDNWMTRDLVITVFHYVFVQQGCARVFAMMDESNTHALDIVRRLRFTECARLPNMFASSDGIVLQLHRDDCHWWKLPLRTLRAGR